MNEDSVESVRESTRELLKLNRQTYKNEVSDVQRSLKDISISTSNIIEIVQKLKSKSHISVTDLQTLKNSLMNDQKSIEVVLGSHGSLRGLVRELSGHDIKKQCAAAGCFCNLALGSMRACTTVAKAAGPYLIALLDNLATELSVMCIWTLGNLASSGSKVCDMLVAQGALTKLCKLLYVNNEDVQDAAVYALYHFAFQMEDDFSPEHINKTLVALTKMETNLSTCQLSFVLSCHSDFKDLMPEELIHKMLSAVGTSIETHSRQCGQSKCTCEFLYVIRTIANVDEELYDTVLNYFLQNELGQQLLVILNKDNGVLKESLLWLLGNLYKSCSTHTFFNKLKKL